MQDFYTYPARVPTNVAHDSDSFSYNGPGNYTRYRTYLTSDNYNESYGYSGTPVNEQWSIGSNGCNIEGVAPGVGSLNNEGRFSDVYFSSPELPNVCSVNPSCVTNSTQTYLIDGRAFSHPVTWSCSNVDVAR